MKKIKFSKRFEEDFAFYSANTRFAYCKENLLWEIGGNPIPEIGVDSTITVKEAFYHFDTHGKIVSCDDPQQLRVLIVTKRMINWHIKEWASGCLYGEPLKTYIQLFINPPDWVKKALMHQIKKAYIKNSEEFGMLNKLFKQKEEILNANPKST